MDKIKTTLINLGQVVALALMLWPFVIIHTEKNGIAILGLCLFVQYYMTFICIAK